MERTVFVAGGRRHGRWGLVARPAGLLGISRLVLTAASTVSTWGAPDRTIATAGATGSGG